MNIKRYIYFTISLLLTALAPTSLTAQNDADSVRRAHAGIIVVENDTSIRAMEPYGVNSRGLAAYAGVMAKYKHTFPDVNVYCMIIPNAVAFYCPDTAQTWTQDEGPVIEGFLGMLPEGVHPVNVMPTLIDHSEEPIYARTDHHWMPLGAYYAAEEFAFEARVPFLPLSCYRTDTIRNFVGTMRMFSQDKAVGRVPEDFVYYIPTCVDYQTHRTVYTYSTYTTGRGRRKRTHKVLTAKAQPETSFFRRYPDGSAGAYSTFMGGDLNQTSVKTSTKNGRRLLILKDSYGNALPCCLFGSFEEVHVVDCRYFLSNMVDFVRQNHITDILFANNLIHASSPATSRSYEQYLTQHK